MTIPDTSRFYADLPPFKNEQDLTEPVHYFEAPTDWFVFVTDVRGSTAAVASGRYKAVNTIGAASIITAQNACPEFEFPFVFGGDGATLVVPARGRERVAQALLALAQKSRSDFGLDLRVGCVPVENIHACGKRVLVAKRCLSEGNCIAMFAGGGLNEATAMIKQTDGTWLLGSHDKVAANVEGLECRWCAVPARRDGILSLIVHAPGENMAVYREVLAQIRQIAPDALPVTPANLPVQWPPEFLIHESTIKHAGWLAQRLHYLAVLALTSILTVLVNMTKTNEGSAAAQYIDSLCCNTDYLKLDDYLRMVIDVSHEQRARIENQLDYFRRSHGAVWGSHFSAASLFTCMVRSHQVHLHFVDGSDGGYTAAARDMEKRNRLPLSTLTHGTPTV
jgi:hypothetical protein